METLCGKLREPPSSNRLDGSPGPQRRAQDSGATASCWDLPTTFNGKCRTDNVVGDRAADAEMRLKTKILRDEPGNTIEDSRQEERSLGDQRERGLTAKINEDTFPVCREAKQVGDSGMKQIHFDRVRIVILRGTCREAQPRSWSGVGKRPSRTTRRRGRLWGGHAHERAWLHPNNPSLAQTGPGTCSEVMLEDEDVTKFVADPCNVRRKASAVSGASCDRRESETPDKGGRTRGEETSTTLGRQKGQTAFPGQSWGHPCPVF